MNPSAPYLRGCSGFRAVSEGNHRSERSCNLSAASREFFSKEAVLPGCFRSMSKVGIICRMRSQPSELASRWGRQAYIICSLHKTNVRNRVNEIRRFTHHVARGYGSPKLL